MRYIILLGILVSSCTVAAQDVFPDGATTTTIDSLLNQAYYYEGKKDAANTRTQVKLIDDKLGALAGEFPLYEGVISLFQSFYIFDTEERIVYRTKGLGLLKSQPKFPAASFAYAFNNLLRLHYSNNRMSEWLAADTLFRASMAENKTKEGYRYAIMNYAADKLKEKEYFVAKHLAMYDYNMLLYKNSRDPMDKLNLRYDDWMVLNADLEVLLEMPYEQRFPGEYAKQIGWTIPLTPQDRALNNELLKMDFRKSFKTLISRMKDLKQEMVTDNAYGSSTFNRNLRGGYYLMYSRLIKDYYNWAVSEHKEGQVILDMKEFIFNDLLSDEIEVAVKAGLRPVIDPMDYIDLVDKLAILYEHIGNGFEEQTIALRGLDLVINSDLFTLPEFTRGIVVLRKNLVSADRLQNNYEASLENSQRLKKYAPLPDSATEKYLPRWETFMDARLEEMYTLLASQQYQQAKDSMKKLIDDVQPIDDGSDFALLYSTRAWPHMQYLIATMMAQKGEWMEDLLQESVRDIQDQSPKPSIFYPVQLAFLKTYWRTRKKIHESTLSNLLFYTGRQLRYNFIMLNASDRIRLYEQRLSQYFDVYHELLFSQQLDAYPVLKRKVIAQSLSLKKILTDGNQIPDELLLRSNDSLSIKILEDLRSLRQETNLYLQNTRLRNKYAIKATAMQDKMQVHWLNQLEKAGMDSLVQLTDWRTISGLLKPEQVYTETIRYNKWLSDSSAFYGAFVILPGNKMEILNLFPESQLSGLLKDPTSSPQTTALGSNSNRGLIKKTTETASKKFEPGSTDKLGELLLQPFWPYLQDKKEWVLVQDGLLNRISFAALQWKLKYLFSYIHLRQLSGSYSLALKEQPMPKKGKVLLAGGLTYGDADTDNENKLFSPGYNWNYLPGTKEETEKLQQVFTTSGYTIKQITGKQFPDTAITTLPQYPFIHIASHGFYLDSIAAKESYTNSWNHEAVQYEPLFRCGIAVSNANNPDSTLDINSEGYLMGFELANLDLRKCYLISLSACETGLGDVRNNLGVDGLSRALKLSGARHLLISLWKVPDKPTAFFMEEFYKHLFSGKTPSQALQLTQSLMSKTYAATDWAAFVLVE